MQLSDPQKRLRAALFVCALSINLILILSIDLYVPALPSMQRAFAVSAAYLNLTVFVFFAFSAVGVVLAGPVSDRFGRTPRARGGVRPLRRVLPPAPSPRPWSSSWRFASDRRSATARSSPSRRPSSRTPTPDPT
ncbi:MAG: hypothetical protein V8S24_06615 [Gordonibacter pamelaeae]